MTYSLIISMILFSLFTSITPGPVNLIALTNGVHYGFKKSLMPILGATFGFTLLLLGLGLGLYNILILLPFFLSLLKYTGVLFLFYMAWLLIVASPQLSPPTTYSNSFWGGFILQWINPKAWMACVTGIGLFKIETFYFILVFALIYFIICFLSIACWALMGVLARQYVYSNSRYFLYFNRSMAICILMCALYMCF